MAGFTCLCLSCRDGTGLLICPAPMPLSRRPAHSECNRSAQGAHAESRLLRPINIDHWSWQDTKRHGGALGWSSEPSVSCDACRPLPQDSAAEVQSTCAETPQRSLCRHEKATPARHLSVIIDACQTASPSSRHEAGPAVEPIKLQPPARMPFHSSRISICRSPHVDVLPISLPAFGSPEGQPPPPAW